MKILFLGGVFDNVHHAEIFSKTKTYVENAANNFQRKIIEGFHQCGVPVQVLSAPFLGAFPQAYKEMYFRGFDPSVTDASGYQYVPFNNIWGMRNFSRRWHLQRHLRDFIAGKDPDKLLLVYSPHTPFVQAAQYAKRQDPRIKICLIVPDLPQYMNLSSQVSTVYTVCKKWDIRSFMRANCAVDTYVLLTQQMKDPLAVGNRPYTVVEGIYEPFTETKLPKQPDVVSIVYTGVLHRSFGILNLLQAFAQLSNPCLRLIICGNGEAKADVLQAAQRDSRILYKGQVPFQEAKQYLLQGDILVNPRTNNSSYTKYSFPSKIIDYLSTGNTVVAYPLEGMPLQYKDFIYFVPGSSAQALARTIQQVLEAPLAQRQQKSQAALQYLHTHISKVNVARIILQLNAMKQETC